MALVFDRRSFLLGLFAAAVWPAGAGASESTAKKPSPDEVLRILKQGNERFVSGKSLHPRSDVARLAQAGKENQGDHAVATVLTCSDSRIPVERIFDAGIMDIFVIRLAGNVCKVDEIGSIEYGLGHVHTPVLVVLGHTQCGAVTAVARAVLGHGEPLERNIPPLIAPIKDAVRLAMKNNPGIKGEAIVPLATEANVWLGIESLFMESPAVRALVREKKAKVTGAIYDVATGKVSWLPLSNVENILKKVEASPSKAVNPMAAG